MRQDYVERYAAEGHMPAMARLLREGVRGVDGVLPPMPTNTGAGWATLLTGAWSGHNGAVNNSLHERGDPINVGRFGFGAELLEAETIVEAAERGGLRTLTFEWASTYPARGRGPVVAFRDFFSGRGIATTHPPAVAKHELARRGLFAERLAFAPAAGRRNLPPSALPPMAARFTLPTQDRALNPNRTLHLLATAATAAGYDRLLVAETPDAAAPLLTLAPGEWRAGRLPLPDGGLANLWLKLAECAPDLGRVTLIATSLTRTLASPPALADRIAAWELPPAVTADYGPLQAGLVDEDEYVEQALLWFEYARPALARLVAEARPDLLLVGCPLTDEFSHQFLALTTPAFPGYDPATAAHYEERLRLAYRLTDEFLAFAQSLLPPDTVTLVSSDHGFAAAWRAVNANQVLHDANLLDLTPDGRPAATSRAVCYAAGGTGNVYLNIEGRDPGGMIPPADRAIYQQQVIAAFQSLRDLDYPDAPVLARALTDDEAAAVETGEGPANMRHSTRTGDVLLFLQPPYQFDAAQPGVPVSAASLRGQHGYLPDALPLSPAFNMRAAFLLAGPGIRQGIHLEGARAIDLAPTLAHALGIEGPRDADGRVLHDAFESVKPGAPSPPAPLPD